jgi:hypothetical protein
MAYFFLKEWGPKDLESALRRRWIQSYGGTLAKSSMYTGVPKYIHCTLEITALACGTRSSPLAPPWLQMWMFSLVSRTKLLGVVKTIPNSTASGPKKILWSTWEEEARDASLVERSKAYQLAEDSGGTCTLSLWCWCSSRRFHKERLPFSFRSQPQGWCWGVAPGIRHISISSNTPQPTLEGSGSTNNVVPPRHREEQQWSRATMAEMAMLIVRGHHLQKQLHPLPPWKQVWVQLKEPTGVIRLKSIYSFWCSMLVFTPFS